MRNKRFVAEALAKYMFGLTNAGEVGEAMRREDQIFQGSLGVETEVVRHWMRVLGETPRNVLTLKKDDSVVSALESEMKRVCTRVSVVDSEMDLKDEVKVFADNAVSESEGSEV